MLVINLYALYMVEKSFCILYSATCVYDDSSYFGSIRQFTHVGTCAWKCWVVCIYMYLP